MYIDWWKFFLNKLTKCNSQFHSMFEIEFLVMNQFFRVSRTGRLVCYLTTLNTSVSTGLLSSGFDATAALFLVSSSWVLAAFTDLAHLSISFAIWKITEILKAVNQKGDPHGCAFYTSKPSPPPTTTTSVWNKSPSIIHNILHTQMTHSTN